MENKEVLFLIIIGIILIIGVAFSVISIIDNRISNIAVKIPQIKVPKPNVIVQLCNGSAVDQDGDKVEVISIDSNHDNHSTPSNGSSFNDTGSGTVSDTSYMSHTSEHEVRNAQEVHNAPEDHIEGFEPVIQYSDAHNINRSQRPQHIKEGFWIKGHNITEYM